MTRDEFEVLMSADGWTPEQRYRWRKITPACDRSTFYREMAKPTGLIEVFNDDHTESFWLLWRRFWDKNGLQQAPSGFRDGPTVLPEKGEVEPKCR